MSTGIISSKVSDREKYLNKPVVKGFIDYFSKVISGEIKIGCEYKPEKSKTIFYADTLEDALNKYAWNKKNFTDNKIILENLSNKLKLAIENNDEFKTLVICLKILKWGGVESSIGWLSDVAEEGVLIDRLKKSITFMDGDDLNSVDMFNKNNILRCDSGTTKIFSLGSKKSIIYDGRVSCALGMIIIDYLKNENICIIPDELNILMDSGSKRKPNGDNFKFIYKSPNIQQSKIHAISNIYSNWIFEQVVGFPSFKWEKCNLDINSDLTDKIRALEAALFMVGYISQNIKFKETGYYLVAK